MPTLAINIPPDLYEQVKISAHTHRRSINQEILRRLETSLPTKRIDVDTLLSRVDALQKDIVLPFLTDEALQEMKRGRT